jgi:hypothetical protein
MTIQTNAPLTLKLRSTPNGFELEVSPPAPPVNLGCFGRVMGSKPGAQKNWNFDLE